MCPGLARREEQLLILCSPNMIPKQKEMDEIVKQVYQAMSTNPSLESTLLVLAGDHGMNDAGNHGGSSAGETSPALVFISPKLATISSGYKVPLPRQESFEYFRKVVQSDIVPTLSALLEFPIPRNNLGVIIPELLDLWPSGGLFFLESKNSILMISRGRQAATPASKCQANPIRHKGHISLF